MQLSCTLQPGYVLNAEVSTIKQAFAFVAHTQQIFGTKKCGNCGSPDLRLAHKTPKGYEYFSVQCQSCRHELKFGQAKESGKLFPKAWEPPFSGDDNGEAPQQSYAEPQYHYNQTAPAPAPPMQAPAAPQVASTEIPF